MPKSIISKRFGNLLPVVIDVETAGLNEATDALLEIAAVLLDFDDSGKLVREETINCHVLPFAGANIDPEALEINGIDPYHPFRFAVEEAEALTTIFNPIWEKIKQTQCQRAVLVGHNAAFDLGFIKAAKERCKLKKMPFHRFTIFDTATLAGVMLGETVLVKACRRANISFDQKEAHSAIYDAEKTADLFCQMVNNLENP